MATRAASEVPPFIQLAGHPLRWRLLVELGESDQRVRELVERLGEPQNLVSYHLRLLRDRGLVTARHSSHDGRDIYYHLDLGRCADALAAIGATLHPALRSGPPPPDRPTAAQSRVLFVCTGNSARSPIAEALLRHRTGGRVVVSSAGVAPRRRLHPHAVRVLRERYDLDVSAVVPRAIDDAGPGSLAAFDHVVTLCDKARERLPRDGGRRRTHWSVPDPADPRGRAGYAGFVATATDIDTRVRHLVPVLDQRR